MYAGLRLGGLLALRGEDVDLGRGLLHVRRSWDPKEGPVDPKSQAGLRTVPIPAALRRELEGRVTIGGSDLVFGRGPETPFSTGTLVQRAKRHWAAAGMTPIGLHECRHTFASLTIAAGVNLKALQVFMGHASITVTLGRYRHLMPASESEAAALLDAYLAATEDVPEQASR